MSGAGQDGGGGRGPAPSSSRLPALPSHVGPFAVEGVLGRGAFGVVLRGRDPAGRAVAIKLLAAETSGAERSARSDDARRLERLRREGQLAARIRHSGVAVVHDLVELPGGRLALVSELVEGATLEEVAPTLERDGRVELVLQVARAVGAAHAQGVVHRDLKPQNILVEAATGAAKVIDFGLATAADLERLTRTGAMVGTPSWMAPEQLRGEPVGPPADVWALGVLLYEALVLQLPFPAEGLADLVRRVSTEAPPTPRSLDPSVPLAVEALTLRALSRAPARRPADGAAFAAELEAALAQGQGGRGAPRLLVALAGAAALAGLLAVGSLAWSGRRRATSDDAATTAAPTSGALAGAGSAGAVTAGTGSADQAATLVRDGAERLARDDPSGLALLEQAGEGGRAEAWLVGARWLLRPAPGRTPCQAYLDPAAARDGPRALRWLQKAAALGSIEAKRRLGEAYDDGWVLPEDPAQAARLYLQAAEAGDGRTGDGRAMDLLGRLYEDGRGVPKDAARGKEWKAKALVALRTAPADDLPARTTLGQRLADVAGTRAEGVELLRAAAQAGDPEASPILGIALLSAPELAAPGETVRALEAGADMWDGQVALALGLEASRRAGAARDPARAARWFDRAVELSEASDAGEVERAQLLVEVATFLLDDPAMAARRADGRAYFERAVRLEGRWAIVLAERFARGIDGAPDVQGAITWAVVAVFAHPDTQERAELLVRGLDTPTVRATLAAIDGPGSGGARHLLGALHENGVGGPVDLAAAAAAYSMAVAEGVKGSRWALARVLWRDDPAGAVEAARPLVQQGDKRALRLMGMAHALGRGAPRDDKQAVAYLVDARRKGDELAGVRLAELLHEGRAGPKDDPGALRLLAWAREGLVKKKGLNDLRDAARVGVAITSALADEEAEVEWLRVGADAGDPVAMRALGERLVAGEGVARDEAAGRALLERAAATPDPD